VKKKPKASARMMLMMSKAMSGFTPTCNEVSRLTSQALDEKLALRHRLGVKIHLLFCKWCRLYKKQLQVIDDMLRRCAVDNLTDDSICLSDAARERMKESLEDQNK